MSRLFRLCERLRSQLADPPRLYLPFVVDGRTVGRVREDFAAHLAGGWQGDLEVHRDRVALRPALASREARTAALDAVARQLSARGLLTAWRDERYAVAAAFGAPPLFDLERAAARFFGIHSCAAHVNGIVGDLPARRMWLARRSPTKAIDPGKVDNLVGGGIASGATVRDTVAKEAWEEAGVDSALARTAVPTGIVTVRRAVPDGWQSETIFVHDLALPVSFVPQPRDGEVVEHRLRPLEDVLDLLGDPDGATLDATLVATDHLVRCGFLRPDEPGYCDIAALLRRRA